MRKPRPAMDQSHGIGRARPQPAGIVVGAELSLVGRHIHVDRAIALATLAGKAELERIGDFAVTPIPRDRTAMQHFEQQARTPAGRMLLFSRDHEARTHHAIAAAEPPALAHADTADRRMAEIVLVVPDNQNASAASVGGNPARAADWR